MPWKDSFQFSAHSIYDTVSKGEENFLLVDTQETRVLNPTPLWE
jgi:hypothetical protein